MMKCESWFCAQDYFFFFKIPIFLPRWLNLHATLAATIPSVWMPRGRGIFRPLDCRMFLPFSRHVDCGRISLCRIPSLQLFLSPMTNPAAQVIYSFFNLSTVDVSEYLFRFRWLLACVFSAASQYMHTIPCNRCMPFPSRIFIDHPISATCAPHVVNVPCNSALPY